MEFEKEVLELEKKIADLKKFSEEQGIDLKEQIEKLEKAYEEKLREKYKNLSSWIKFCIKTSRETIYFRLYRAYDNRFYRVTW